jgi:hypothetical protein
VHPGGGGLVCLVRGDESALPAQMKRLERLSLEGIYEVGCAATFALEAPIQLS